MAEAFTVVLRESSARKGRVLWSAVAVFEGGREQVIVTEVPKPTARAEAKAFRAAKEG